jgi:hypothetical protein
LSAILGSIYKAFPRSPYNEKGKDGSEGSWGVRKALRDLSEVCCLPEEVCVMVKRSRLSRSGGKPRKDRLESAASAQIGDGKAPNKYWVSVSSDYYVHDLKENMLDWASDVKGVKVDGKTLRQFDTYEEAKSYADSIELGGKVHGIEANTVSVEDRFTGQVYERSLGGHVHEDIDFTIAQEKKLLLSSTLRKPAKEYEVTADNLIDYIMRYEDGRISEGDYLKLFSYLIKTGQAWSLQGSLYGRPAHDLIESGVISKTGKIDWDKVDEMKERG